jgi:hypothetical protein
VLAVTSTFTLNELTLGRMAFLCRVYSSSQRIISFLDTPTRKLGVTQRSKSEVPMFDVLMLILGIGSFGLFLGYVTVCEIL